MIYARSSFDANLDKIVNLTFSSQETSTYVLLLLFIENVLSYLIIVFRTLCYCEFLPRQEVKRRLEPVPCTILLLTVRLSSVE